MASVNVKRAHNALSLKQKLDVVEAVEKGGKSKTEIALEFKIPRSTLSTILKNKVKLKEAFSSEEFSRGRQRLRFAAWPKLEDALVLWLKKSRTHNLPVNGVILKEKADELALKLGIDNFKASEGWLMRFKERHGLSFRSICGEAGSVNRDDVNNWKGEKLKEIVKDYHPDDIYNADETGLFFRQLPHKTLSFKSEKCSGGKQSKLRMTVMVCSNWSGTDKLKLLVIGKSKNPRCFKGIQSLPVDYESNSKAWITSDVFTRWVKKLDRKFQHKNRKVLLFIDNCSAHPDIHGLTSIKLCFFPPNTTSVLQPMDQGIIQSLKMNYRKQLMRRILLCYDQGKEYEMDILKAIHFIAYAWTNVTTSTIENCFRHAGFVKGDMSVTDELDSMGQRDEQIDPENLVQCLKEKGCPIPEGFSLNEFSDFDSNLETCYAMTDEEILAQVLDTEKDEESDEADEPSPKIPQITDVLCAIETLQRFVSMQKNSDNELFMISSVEKFVMQCGMMQMKQPVISDYFSKV